MSDARTPQQIIGANIAARRRQKNISQSAIAQASGISERTWQRIEKGEASVDLEAVPMLLEMLEITDPLKLLIRGYYE